MREANYINIGLQLKKIRDQLDWTLDIMNKEKPDGVQNGILWYSPTKRSPSQRGAAGFRISFFVFFLY